MSELLQLVIVVAFGGPDRLHRHTQPLARRNDRARRRPLQLADRKRLTGIGFYVWR